ncbi:hypothetical protein [Evansella cellulosilytica]|uniref:Uncharacterized protein n=1 Tax=Evansella cellulosilytica (strain ATCC 21833 / DSM 2522 / FERM P-1141 / JCM 9156 / N-4) TaxID=649639 RepID=E6TU22_EVAC2|nr:hypothetical protein [Evansella cellulosilytica]ADU32053.1 hypothetical protein Bcell_3814 [Evansella cellulosilytica DSM 2522]
MKSFDTYPKTVKKTVRYIKQDASLEQIKKIEDLILKSIQARKQELVNKGS